MTDELPPAKIIAEVLDRVMMGDDLAMSDWARSHVLMPILRRALT